MPLRACAVAAAEGREDPTGRQDSVVPHRSEDSWASPRGRLLSLVVGSCLTRAPGPGSRCLEVHSRLSALRRLRRILFGGHVWFLGVWFWDPDKSNS